VSVTPEASKASTIQTAVRIIKLGISLLYFAYVRTKGLFNDAPESSCVVLYYHSVPEKYRPLFEKQMRVIADRKLAIDIARLDDLPRGKCSVVITFDDALQNFTDCAVPVLLGFQIPAVVFVVADALGSKPVWAEGYYTPDELIMTREQLCSLPDLVTVGSHTLTHPNLTRVSEETADLEIKQSREKLEAILGRPIPLFSFPHGAYNDLNVSQCRQAGYRRVFSTRPDLVTPRDKSYVVGRVSTDPWDWNAEFLLKIAGAYCWQPAAQSVVRKIKKVAGIKKG
jgi:peptidoglycan/xylan/chitin deacetylase (PgdA/CDA1 family)